MTPIELWTSGATDVFGYRFRDAWHVVGREQGRVAPDYVCWLPSQQEQGSVGAIKPASQQMELFA